MVHEGLACGLDAISALHNYACSIAIGVVSISCLELSGLSQVSSFSSGECGNAILQYCYGFNIGVSSVS